jgi:hypothetical protein
MSGFVRFSTDRPSRPECRKLHHARSVLFRRLDPEYSLASETPEGALIGGAFRAFGALGYSVLNCFLNLRIPQDFRSPAFNSMTLAFVARPLVRRRRVEFRLARSASAS